MRRILHQNSETDKFIWKPKAVEKVVDESRFQEVCWIILIHVWMISNIPSNLCTWFMFIWQAESSDDELADHQFSLLDLKPRELVEASSSEFNLPCQRTWFDHPVKKSNFGLKLFSLYFIIFSTKNSTCFSECLWTLHKNLTCVNFIHCTLN